MAGFVPGRDRVTLEAIAPEAAQKANAIESAERRAALDKEELAELERAQTGARAPRRRRTLLDRLLRRG
jgi:hypothetical protein